MAEITRFDTDPSTIAGRKDRATLRPVLMVACVIALTFAASGKVLAQDDNGDSPTGQGIVDRLMKGMGVQSMDNSGINYRERSPLVIPSNTNLPVPEDKSKVANAPNWPKDPDVTRNKKAAADRKKVAGGDNPRGAYRDSDQYPVSSTDLNKGMSADAKPTPVNTDAPGGDPTIPLTPDQLGYKGGLFSFSKFSLNKKEDAPFKGEPERSSLVQPPVGYQTPSPDYAYGVDPDTKDSTMKPTASEQRIHDGLPN